MSEPHSLLQTSDYTTTVWAESSQSSKNTPRFLTVRDGATVTFSTVIERYSGLHIATMEELDMQGSKWEQEGGIRE